MTENYAVRIRNAINFTVEVTPEMGEPYTVGFVPSILHIDESGHQTVASRGEARPLETEHNFFLDIERKDGEQIYTVSIPVHELAQERVDEIDQSNNWAAQFIDEESATFLFIRRRVGDKWVYRTQTDTIYLTTDQNGTKRAKMMAHRSLGGGIFDREDLNLFLNKELHGPDEQCNRDGTMVGSYELAEMIGIDPVVEPRTNTRVALFMDDTPQHWKGDIVWSETVRGSAHLHTCYCNVSFDGGLMIPEKVVIGATGPQQSGKAVMSNPQLNASAGHVLLDRSMFDNSLLNVWEYQLRAKMGSTVSRVLMGKSPFFTPSFRHDEERNQKLERNAEIASYVENELGDTFIAPSIVHNSVRVAESMYGSNSKHRVRMPAAFSYYMTAPEILEDMEWKGMRPGPREVAFYPFGFVAGKDIFSDIATAGGGADGDDPFAFFIGYVSQGFEFMGEYYASKDLAANMVRFPQGARIHEGEVGVEHSMVRINTETKEYKRIFRQGIFPKLDFHRLPKSVMELPVPTLDKAHAPEKQLTFRKKYAKMAEMRGAYGRFSLRVTSLVYLATTFYKGKLPVDFTLGISMEAAIDSVTKTLNTLDIDAVNAAADEMTRIIRTIINEHLKEVDFAFAKRAGLVDPLTGEIDVDDDVKLVEWSMSKREAQWMATHGRLERFTQFMVDAYDEQFIKAVGDVDGYEKDAIVRRFWAGLKKRRGEGQTEAEMAFGLGSSIAKYVTENGSDCLSNLQRMQVKDLSGSRTSDMISDTLFSLPLVKLTTKAVDVDLHTAVLGRMMETVWLPIIQKAEPNFIDYRDDPFMGEILSGFIGYFGEDDLQSTLTKATQDVEFLCSLQSNAAEEAEALREDYEEQPILCGAPTTRNHPCRNLKSSCTYH